LNKPQPGREFELAHAERFPLELGRAPNKVRNAYQRTVVPVLKTCPDKPDPPRVKRLTGYRDLWRLRVSDEYRLVYKVDQAAKLVTVLMLDTRGKIYDRLGEASDGKPGIRIVARAEDLLEREPTAEEIGNAELALSAQISSVGPPATDNVLPQKLDSTLLASWNVSPAFFAPLASVTTEGELMGLSSVVPDDVLQRVLNGLWPPTIEEVIQQPVRVAFDTEVVEAAADGTESLDSFLLKLDEDQKSFVSRFDGPTPRGPWLLKGGPGSGKSTVALYCIRSLLKGAGELTKQTEPLRILFTTFTKSLVNASHHLLDALGVRQGLHTLHVKNVDSLAVSYLPDEWKRIPIERDTTALLTRALRSCSEADPTFGFTGEDADFLLDEIDWVLLGQDIKSVQSYLDAGRAGRGRRLGHQQKRQVWALFETVQRLMREEGVCLFSERLQLAARNVVPEYDYVFIDEAQDLKPVAIRFCLGLCRDPANVFLTADTNQSIYGNGMSWSTIASDLKFQGRARILRRNYRTTTEIWDAITQLAPSGEETDRETMEVETVFRGPFPVLARYSDEQAVERRLNSYLHESLREERVGPGCGAVLCASVRDMYRTARLIDPRFNAKAMKSCDLDLAHPGVKVITMHAAKGLQFPVVAIVGLEAGKLPSPPAMGMDPAEHEGKQKRLFFVACTRAIRRLIVFGNRERPSPFTSKMTDEYWDIEEL
jgi:superfamily I DNA/RNA helicase/mRNA-degrading endonuclease RelE of RelBE toxin-antitoxin system